MPLITIKYGSTLLVNNDALAERLATALKLVFSEKSVISEILPTTGSEVMHLLEGLRTDVPFNSLVVGVVDTWLSPSLKLSGQPMQVPYAAYKPNFIVNLLAIAVGTVIATIAMPGPLQPAVK
jgi:hypothetical protein